MSDKKNDFEEIYKKSRRVNERLDRSFDGLLESFSKKTKTEKIEEYAIKTKTKIVEASDTIAKSVKKLDDAGEEYASTVAKKRLGENALDTIVEHRVGIILVILIITGLIGSQSLLVFNNIKSDFEVYLPPGDPSSITLSEVRNDFSVDIIMISVETLKKEDNITSKVILEEMSRIETLLDKDRNDWGKADSVIYVFSVSSLIKTINSTPPRCMDAIKKEFPLIPFLNVTDVPGEYAIPDQQSIDRIMSSIPENQMKNLIIDKNGDGRYDSSLILIGLSKDAPQHDVIEKTDEVIKNTTYCKMTNTGPATVLHATQERTTTEFIKAIPLTLFLISIGLFMFHRTFKIVVIAGIPILCALALTFGILGILHDFFVISPQIVMVGSILATLGISYTLYISNKFTEIRYGNSTDRIKLAVKTIHAAIFLSAITTVIGFASLMFGSIYPVVTIGFALAMGITICYILAMIMVPALILVLNYQKRYVLPTWRKIATIPPVHRKKIIAFALCMIVISICVIPMVKTNVDYYLLAPQDEPSVAKLREVATDFGRGQSGMIIVRGDMYDIHVLDFVNQTETRLKEVEPIVVYTIVDIMKMLKVPSTINVAGVDIRVPFNMSFWDAIHSAPQQQIPPSKKSPQQMLIDIFYNTLDEEIKSMLISRDNSKTLIMIDMPTMDVKATEDVVNQVNSVVVNYGNVPGGSFSFLTGTAAIAVAINNLLISSQFQTTALSILLCFLVIAITYRSLKLGLITMIPICIVTALEPLVFVGLNIELSVITVIVASTIIGNGVDFSIQMTQRIKLGGESIESVKAAVEYTGISFVEATVTVVIGLIGISVVPIAVIRQFAAMIMVLYVLSAMAALFILPAIYTIIFKRSENKWD
ncbi:MAG: MMPL family transporter [Thermoplasmata archaeon]